MTLALVMGVLVWLLVVARALLGPLAIAAILAYVLNPVVGFMTRRFALRRHAAVNVVYLVTLVGLLLSLTWLGPIVVRQAQVIAAEVQLLLEEMRTMAPTLTVFDFSLPMSDLAAQLDAFLQQALQPSQAFRVIRTATTNAAFLMVILFCSYYFLRDGARLAGWLVSLAPEDHQYDAHRLVTEVSQVWYDYLRGQLVLMFFVGLLSGLGAALLGIRQAVVLGLLAGALDVVPQIGPFLATAIATAVAWFDGSAFLPVQPAVLALLTIGVYTLVQVAENVWLRPRIIGRSLSLHPAVVFVGVIGALLLSGALLALFIIPLIGSVQILFGYARRRIYALPPWPDEHEMEHETA